MMSEIAEFRAEKDDFFRDSDQSPLTLEQQEAFEGLRYFPEDPTYTVVATLELADDAAPVTMVTSKGTVQTFLRVGRLHFTIHDQPAELTLFQDAEAQSLFLPFSDATSGAETYSAGRYVEVEALDKRDGQHRVGIDFNLAYNPYCAYNEDWICPVPPAENHLGIAIRAGEMNFHA